MSLNSQHLNTQFIRTLILLLTILSLRTCYLHMLYLEHAILYAIVRDSCDIGFRGFQVQLNAEFPRQVMNFPIEYDSADVV